MLLRKIHGKHGWPIIIVGSLFFAIPLLFQYIFVLPNVHHWFIFLLIGWILSRIRFRKYTLKYQIIVNSLLTLFLFVGIVFNSISYLNLGIRKPTGIIEFTDNYEIKQYTSHGFAGSGFLRVYELRHTICFGFYSKKLGSRSVSDNDTSLNCELHYNKHNLTFDHCRKKLWKNN